MLEHCSFDGCAEPVITSLDANVFCYQHFLTSSYRRLEAIAAQIRDPQFHQFKAEAAGRFLEDCMRTAADVACSGATPTNLERARILDVLLWASELHGRLRRGPRLPLRIAVLLRCETPGKAWEEKTETQVVSRYGAQLTCKHAVSGGDTLTCVRLDTGARTETRVVWARQQISGEMDLGIEFSKDTNFWELRSLGSASQPALVSSQGS
jgi:hypothetical protein